MPRRRLSSPVLLALPLLAAALLPAPAGAARSSLPAFETCDDLVSYARGGLSEPSVPFRAMGSYGSAISPRSASAEPPPAPEGRDLPIPMASPVTATADSTAGVGGSEAFSGTNTQEADVDEPDVMKTDGKRLFVVGGTTLWAFDVTADAPKLISKLDLEGRSGELLLRGNRLLVVGTPPAPEFGVVNAIGARQQTTAPAVAPSVSVDPAAAAKTRLAEVDVTDATAMTIVRTMDVPGAVVSARLTGGTIRVVLNSPATVDDMVAVPGAAGASVRPSAAAAKVKQKRRPKLNDFIPRTVLKSRKTDRTFRRNLVPCDNVRHPTSFSGLDLLTVLSVDFDRGLFNVDRDAVMASAQVVYASAANLYVASLPALEVESAADVPKRVKTQIHRFDASKAGETTYTASGSVTGFVLNQYALSEEAGDLRVASTEVPLWLGAAPTTPSESAVTVLRQSGNRLATIGRVGGLGKDERIYATRFIGTVGYLVTFRQTDPLYTLDLSDPTAPKVVGELKINGYSAYLHPIAPGLLLGVGQDATDSGRRTGSQLSIFDVSNPAAPVRTSQLALTEAGGSSSAEFDPHAFLWWARANTAIVPVTSYDARTYRPRNAAVAVSARRVEGLAKVGEITHGPEWDHPPVDRSFVVGDRVFSISDLGVSANRMPGLQPLGFAAFG